MMTILVAIMSILMTYTTITIKPKGMLEAQADDGSSSD